MSSAVTVGSDAVVPTLENLLFSIRSPRQLTWSPDGTRIAMAIAGAGASQLAILDVSTKELRTRGGPHRDDLHRARSSRHAV
jgi:Tol biopolymer transport system component